MNAAFETIEEERKNFTTALNAGELQHPKNLKASGRKFASSGLVMRNWKIALSAT
ncbi:MAG: hypothetical protein PGN20_12180 [Agrobacterium cavarae]